MERFAVILLVAVFALAVPSCHRGGEKPADPPQVPEIPYDSLREGDLAFRKGTGALSHMLTLTAENKDYSHVGVLFLRDSEWVVVHAVPDEPESDVDYDRVKSERLTSFFASNRAIYGELVHTPVEDSKTIARMHIRALRWVRDSIRFDHSYVLGDTTKLYCTELAWTLYHDEGIDLSEGRRTIWSLPAISDTLLFPEDIRHYRGNHTYFKFKHQYTP